MYLISDWDTPYVHALLLTFHGHQIEIVLRLRRHFETFTLRLNDPLQLTLPETFVFYRFLMQAVIIVKLEGIIELLRVQLLKLELIAWDQLCTRQVWGVHRLPLLVLLLQLLWGGAEQPFRLQRGILSF